MVITVLFKTVFLGWRSESVGQDNLLKVGPNEGLKQSSQIYVLGGLQAVNTPHAVTVA